MFEMSPALVPFDWLVFNFKPFAHREMVLSQFPGCKIGRLNWPNFSERIALQNRIALNVIRDVWMVSVSLCILNCPSYFGIYLLYAIKEQFHRLSPIFLSYLQDAAIKCKRIGINIQAFLCAKAPQIVDPNTCAVSF